MKKWLMVVGLLLVCACDSFYPGPGSGEDPGPPPEGCCLYSDSTDTKDNSLLNTIRLFRDECLKGNCVGDKVVDFYYDSLSPRVVQYMHLHKGAYKYRNKILLPATAKFCEIAVSIHRITLAYKAGFFVCLVCVKIYLLNN